MMRISVRNQLSILLVLSSTIGLATLGIATWCTVHSYVLNVSRDGLETAASLKAVELAISLDLMYTSCLYISALGLVQQALKRYNNGSDTTAQNWDLAHADMAATLDSKGSLQHTPAVQSQLRARNMLGPAGQQSVLNTTGAGNTNVALPWEDSNGHKAYLGEGTLGYPPSLYPNLTISKQSDVSSGSYIATYNGETLGIGSNLILGPLTVNNSYSLLSMTIPVIDNYSETNILGWLTVVQNTRLIDRILDDYTGLGQTGLTLLLGPTSNDNLFSHGGTPTIQRDVRFLIPVRPSATSRCPTCTGSLIFPAKSYPAVESALSDGFHGRQELGSLPSTHNELGQKVSVAYATPPTKLVDWIVIVEQSASEFWNPVDQLRTIILACLFSVLGFFFFASFPIAHWAVRPITRLRAATQSTIDPLYQTSNGSIERHDDEEEVHPDAEVLTKTGFLGTIFGWRRKQPASETQDRHRKRFRIPSKVDTSHHWVQDDLLDLMETFNEMSDELFMQYSKLEERVRMRTLELDQSKRAAEAANESKTLFVANVSHELKTPLNGILGMCATSIEDNDTEQMRMSLNIIYKSGDLLLRTLNDLLTFSTNQVGSRELMLEEREFSLQDLEAQVLTIFEKQAVDKAITLRFECEDVPAYAVRASAGLKEMTIWGDVHRILQIIINLVSNSMKYTPERGTISVIVRRSAEQAPRRLSLWPEQISMQSRKSAQTRRTRTSLGTRRSARDGTANFINPTEAYQLQEQSLPPPGNDLYIEFDVQDTGQGIPEEMQSRIFEPFVQGEGGLNRRHSGTGLGLSICNQLTTLMRGTITLKSTVGVGTTFTVKLPLRQVMGTPSVNLSIEIPRRLSLVSSATNTEKYDEKVSEKDMFDHSVVASAPTEIKGSGVQANEPTPPLAIIPGSPSEKEELKTTETLTPRPSMSHDATAATPKPTKTGKKDHRSNEQYDFSKLRVLVAEDNKVNQQVILRMLKMEQILQVTIAEDGQQALDRIKELQDPESPEEKPCDLIFMDIQMPNMDGLTSTRLIRETGYQGPIVALTAYAEKNNIDDCFESGMNHFLAKPLKKPQLHDALTRLCSKEESKGSISKTDNSEK